MFGGDHRSRVATLFAVTSLLLVCSGGCRRGQRTEEPGPSHPPECRAGVLPPGGSLVGTVRKPPRPVAATVRLVDSPFTVEAPSVPRQSPAIERISEHVLRKWSVVSTPLGPRRQSEPFATPAKRADTLVLEVAHRGVDAFDLAVLPVGEDLTDVERLHRTVRLDFPSTVRGAHTFEVALEPLLRGSWQDAPVELDRFRIELSASLPADALRRVEVRGRNARFEEAAGQRIDGPSGNLRPSLYLRSGVSLRLPVPASDRDRTLVFHLHAPIGQPEVSVSSEGGAFAKQTHAASQAHWTRHEVTVPASEEGEVRFESTGRGIALIGDPALWLAPEQPRRPDVVIYMVDTLLASRVGALGSQVAGVSPVMDSLVRDGLAFVRATSTSAWTKPAIPSLLTGVYPLTHRIGTRNYTDRLPTGAPMLQERFRDAGFRTLSSSASPLGSTLSGLERGFDLAHPPARWSDELGPLGHPDARQVQHALLAFIEEDPSRPVFAYLHTLDVHEFERPMFAAGADGETPYDRAVRHQDTALGDLLDAYRALDRELILVLVSDHGEGFGEYGVKAGHGYSVRQNQLHVPLVFHSPHWLPRGRLVEPASLVDVAPTLLDLFSLPALPGAQGRSLLPGPNADEAPEAVFAERTWFLWEPEGAALLARVGADGRKLVTGYPRPVSWHLGQSPCEDTARVVRPEPNELSEMSRFVQEQGRAAQWWDASYGESAPVRIDPDDIARLRALGYLQ
jgi:arylsulfatase A-like enzyme